MYEVCHSGFSHSGWCSVTAVARTLEKLFWWPTPFFFFYRRLIPNYDNLIGELRYFHTCSPPVVSQYLSCRFVNAQKTSEPPESNCLWWLVHILNWSLFAHSWSEFLYSPLCLSNRGHMISLQWSGGKNESWLAARLVEKSFDRRKELVCSSMRYTLNEEHIKCQLSAMHKT